MEQPCEEGTGTVDHRFEGLRPMKYWRIPLDSAEIEVSRGIVCIIEERCKGCGYCIAFCPRDVLELARRYNAKGYRPPVAIKPDACVNCHYCEIICPDLAIYSIEAPAEPEISSPGW
jgi:2-oxoglutarate ferredoxin oxidoreductase subunit delta